MLRTLYVGLVHRLRGPIDRIGILRLLDRGTAYRPVHWLRSLFAVYDVEDLASLDTPWWCYRGIDQVEGWLEGRPAPIRAFEWGSGASTMWLARRVDEVHSVEHHEGFAEVVRGIAPSNVRLVTRPPTEAASDRALRSEKPGNEGLDFRAYADAIDEVDGDFDLIIIDGRVRAACLARAKTRLAADGLIVFDNSQRRRYRDALEDPALDIRTLRGLTPASPVPSWTTLVRRREDQTNRLGPPSIRSAD